MVNRGYRVDRVYRVYRVEVVDIELLQKGKNFRLWQLAETG